MIDRSVLPRHKAARAKRPTSGSFRLAKGYKKGVLRIEIKCRNGARAAENQFTNSQGAHHRDAEEAEDDGDVKELERTGGKSRRVRRRTTVFIISRKRTDGHNGRRAGQGPIRNAALSDRPDLRSGRVDRSTPRDGDAALILRCLGRKASYGVIDSGIMDEHPPLRRSCASQSAIAAELATLEARDQRRRCAPKAYTATRRSPR